MGAVKFVFGSLCAIVIGAGWVPDGDMLGKRNKVVRIAASQLGVKELSGHNDGKEVEMYLAYVGLKKGLPWCSAYVSWVFGQSGFKQPRSGWCPALFPPLKITKEAMPGNVLGIWFPALKRIAHVGIVESTRENWILSLEGNTGNDGSREGSGVFRRLRHKRSVHSYADWLNLNKN